MDVKPGINCVTKWCDMYALLTITVAMAVMGLPLARETSQNSSVHSLVNISVRVMMVTKTTSQLAEGKSSKSAVAGTAVILDCPQHRYDLVVWNVYLNNGTNCHLSYMSEKKLIDKNCGENMNWLSRPDQLPSLQIKSSQISSEGTYKCSVAYANGTFIHEYSLTVLVPPVLSLIQNVNGTPVCKAAAGKPVAQISWVPTGYSETETEVLPNGTKTITSAYNVTNASKNEVSCIVSHPAWKEPHVLNLSGKYTAEEGDTTMRILYSSLTCLLGIFILLLFIYLWRFFYGRKTDINALKSPETISTRPSFQENDPQPYATFVQVENVIYDKAIDFSLGFSSSA